MELSRFNNLPIVCSCLCGTSCVTNVPTEDHGGENQTFDSTLPVSWKTRSFIHAMPTFVEIIMLFGVGRAIVSCGF